MNSGQASSGLQIVIPNPGLSPGQAWFGISKVDLPSRVPMIPQHLDDFFVAFSLLYFLKYQTALKISSQSYS